MSVEFNVVVHQSSNCGNLKRPKKKKERRHCYKSMMESTKNRTDHEKVNAEVRICDQIDLEQRETHEILKRYGELEGVHHQHQNESVD